MKLPYILIIAAFSIGANAQVIKTIAGDSIQGYLGDGGQATVAELNNPSGVAIDVAQNIYIADQFNNRIRKVSPLGIITTFAGNGNGASTGTGSFSGDGGQATLAGLFNPTGVTVDATGNLYVADKVNHRIRKVNTSGVISTVAGNGTAGFSGDGGMATNAELNNPYSVAINGAGDLLISDQSNYIRKVDVLGVITTIAGNGMAGFSGDGGQATNATLNSPSGITIDKKGNIYIADGNRIRMINSFGIINTIVGGGSTLGDGGIATSAKLNLPKGITIDSIGNIYIADWGNQRIRKVDTSGIINTIAGNGVAGFSGDGGSATSAELGFPNGIILDSTGNIYISDYGNNRIRKVNNANTIEVLEISANTPKILAYPNPNDGNFNLAIDRFENYYSIDIVDVSGRLIKEIPIVKDANLQISLPHLSSGFYFLKIHSSKWQLNSKLIIQY
jgi:hypothetical protein